MKYGGNALESPLKETKGNHGERLSILIVRGEEIIIVIVVVVDE